MKLWGKIVKNKRANKNGETITLSKPHVIINKGAQRFCKDISFVVFGVEDKTLYLNLLHNKENYDAFTISTGFKISATSLFNEYPWIENGRYTIQTVDENTISINLEEHHVQTTTRT